MTIGFLPAARTRSWIGAAWSRPAPAPAAAASAPAAAASAPPTAAAAAKSTCTSISALCRTVSTSPPSTPPASMTTLGRAAAILARSWRRSLPAVWYSTTPPAPSAASRAAIAVIFAVRPCTVIRRPPAAELVARNSRGSSGPVDASIWPRAAFTPTVTSPSSTEVAATPCPRRPGVAPFGAALAEMPSKALTTVVVEPISATSTSTGRAAATPRARRAAFASASSPLTRRPACAVAALTRRRPAPAPRRAPAAPRP